VAFRCPTTAAADTNVRVHVSQPVTEIPVHDDAVLRLEDTDGRYRAVRLVTDLLKREPPRPFTRVGDAWELRLSLPAVDRLEYVLQVVTANGSVEVVLHPGAPTASGPFGEKSVLELSGYRAPAWLDAAAPAGERESVALPSERLGDTVEGLVWRPDGTEPDEPLPLVVVHDGPEYAEHTELLGYLAAAVAAGDAPPVRVALLAPLARDDQYGASPRYAAALVDELVPALTPTGPVAGLGASLGALALLHAHASRPGAFAGLFLQSGSFFQPATDPWEESHPRFGPITRFVARVLAGRERAPAVPVTLTCGAAEENVANNRALRNALARQGYEVELALVRDAHTWVGWRDSFDPHLARLLSRLWG
jgi:enterochelin esterase-like enzyme